MGFEPFGFVVALFGLAFLLACAALPAWIIIKLIRFGIRQINITYKQIIDIKK